MYNLYAKLFQIYSQDKSQAHVIETMVQIRGFFIFVWWILIQLLLSYGLYSAGFFLKFVLGDSWVSEVKFSHQGSQSLAFYHRIPAQCHTNSGSGYGRPGECIWSERVLSHTNFGLESFSVLNSGVSLSLTN